MIDRIEYHVEHAVDYVQTATQVNWQTFGPYQFCQSTTLVKKTLLLCICVGHKESAEVPVKGETGEKTF